MYSYTNIEKLVFSAKTNGTILVTLFRLLKKIPLFRIFQLDFNYKDENRFTQVLLPPNTQLLNVMVFTKRRLTQTHKCNETLYSRK